MFEMREGGMPPRESSPKRRDNGLTENLSSSDMEVLDYLGPDYRIEMKRGKKYLLKNGRCIWSGCDKYVLENGAVFGDIGASRELVIRSKQTETKPDLDHLEPQEEKELEMVEKL